MPAPSPIDFRQRKADVMTTVDAPAPQAVLPLVRRAEANSEPVEKVRRCRSAAHAFSLACASSGLEDKEICGGLGVDAGYFSRMKTGKATLDAGHLALFCEIVGNRIYPEFLAYQVGCTLVEIETETQRQLRAAQEQLAEARLAVRVLTDALHGRTTK